MQLRARLRVVLVLAALVIPALVQAQPNIRVNGVGSSIRLVVDLPATCDPTSGETVVYKTTAPIGLHECKTLNTWTATGSGGGGGTITCLDTGVLFSDGADNPVCDAGFTYDPTTDTATVGALTLPTPVNPVRLVGVNTDGWDNESAVILVDATSDLETSLIIGGSYTDATHYSGILLTAIHNMGSPILELTPILRNGASTLFDGAVHLQAGNGNSYIKVDDAAGAGTGLLELLTGSVRIRMREDETPVGVAITSANTTFSGTTTAAAFISATANPAADGVIRLGNLDAIVARNAANNNDIPLITTDLSDVVRIAGGAIDIDTAAADAVTFLGIVKAAGYKSSDGTDGLTQTCAVAVTAVTIKNGLITAVTCP